MIAASGSRLTQSGLQRDRAALRKTREHDARSCNAALDLARNQRFDLLLRRADSFFIFAPQKIDVDDVVPRAHHRAAVDCYRHRRRMREDVAAGRRTKRLQLTHDRHEVIAVGTEAMQPDHAWPSAEGCVCNSTHSSSSVHGPALSRRLWAEMP